MSTETRTVELQAELQEVDAEIAEVRERLAELRDLIPELLEDTRPGSPRAAAIAEAEDLTAVLERLLVQRGYLRRELVLEDEDAPGTRGPS
ncbi:MAG: hypothetical protein JWN46_1201 [Acidimicrobiales bacterium]|nr:hypothetical protein [Acidimicrobiales bacterium]